MGAVLATLRLLDGMTRQRRAALLDARHSPSDFLGPGAQMSSFSNAQGHEIATYWWPARKPRGMVLIVHGQGAYLVFEYCRNTGVGKSKRYDGSWIQALNEAGYSVAGIDNQGTGRSGGRFGDVVDFRHFVGDILDMAALMRSPDAPAGFGGGLPLFGMGCSLGGCIVLQGAMRQPSTFRGLVLLAPMLSLERVKTQGANRLLVPISHVLAALIPTWPIVATPKNVKFPDLQEDWDADPAVYHYPARVRIGCQLMRACEWLAPRLGTVVTPLLVFHSENDTMVDPDGSKALIRAAKTDDKTLRMCNSFWHVLTKEQGNEALLAEAVGWMGDRLGAAEP